MDSNVLTIFATTVACGVVGSVLGAVWGFRSGDARLRVGNSAGLGFLLGAALGALYGIFQSMIGRVGG